SACSRAWKAWRLNTRVARRRSASRRLDSSQGDDSFVRAQCRAFTEDFMTCRTQLQTLIRISATAASIAILSVAATQIARADDPAKILKGMADYLAGQKSLSAKFDSDIEVVTPELQKIQFTSSGEVKMNRPDKLRIRRTGGYADVELVFDGKTVSLYGNNAKSYVQD